MRSRSRSYRVCGLAAVVAMVLFFGSTGRAAVSDAQVVLQWNKIAEDIVTTPPPGAMIKTYQNEGLIYMAYVSAAIYDAAVAIKGGFEPYGFDVDACSGGDGARKGRTRFSIDASPDASVQAAVATAAYRILVKYFPSDATTLDTRYAESLAAISDGQSKQDGITVGNKVARQLICLRAGDNLPALTQTSSFEHRDPGPGVWRLTPPYALPQTPWVGDLQPFVLRTVDQFHPAPPPSLESPQWVAEFNEVKAYGDAAHAADRPQQSATATFWTANVIRQYNRLGRDIATAQALDAPGTARLLAMINIVGADAQIAVMHWKYHFLFWRPVTAIDPCSVIDDIFGPAGCDDPLHPPDSDRNPATVEEVGWRPFIGTPNHPEYPAAHGSLTGAITEVLTEFFGTDQLNVDIHGSPGDTVRHFATAEEIVQEIVDARVWAGVHYRGSVESGVKLGQKVARFDLNHAFQPAR